MKSIVLLDGTMFRSEDLKSGTYQVITKFNSIEKLEEHLKLNLNEIYVFSSDESTQNDEFNNNKFFDKFIEKVEKDNINPKDFYLVELHNTVSNGDAELYLTNSKEEIFDILFARNFDSNFLLEESEKGNIYYFIDDKDFFPFFNKRVNYLNSKSLTIQGEEKAIKKIKNKANCGFVNDDQIGIFMVEKEIPNGFEILVFDNEIKARKYLKK